MRTIAHLSDLHFGRTDPASPRHCSRTIAAIAPRRCRRLRRPHPARAGRVQGPRAFPRPPAGAEGRRPRQPRRAALPRLGALREPARRYRAHHDDLQPSYVGRRARRLGVNTARSLTFKNGRINDEQRSYRSPRASIRFAESVVKIVVTHHPFDLPDEPGNDALVGRAKRRWKPFRGCCEASTSPLAGHFHTSQAWARLARALRSPATRRSSSRPARRPDARGRGEQNSFNVLRVASDARRERQVWAASDGGAFVRTQRALPRATARAGCWRRRARRARLVLEQAPHHLARARLRQRLDELDEPGHLVGGHAVAARAQATMSSAVVLPFTGAQNDDRLHRVSPR